MTAPQRPRHRRRALVAAALFLLLGSTVFLLNFRARRVRPSDPVAPGHGDHGVEAFIVHNAQRLGPAGKPLLQLTSCSACHANGS